MLYTYCWFQKLCHIQRIPGKVSQDISGDEASLERELGLPFPLSLSLFSLHENWLSALLPPDGTSWLSRLSGPGRVASGSELGYPGSDPGSSTNRLCDLDQERNLRVPQFPHLSTVVNVIDLNRIVLSRSTLCDPMDCSPPGSPVHGDSPSKNTGVGCHALLQIFPTPGSNLGLLHCRPILYRLSYQGSLAFKGEYYVSFNYYLWFLGKKISPAV